MSFEEANVKYSHFEGICRFCLKRDLFLKPIFPEEDDEIDDFTSDCGNGNETIIEMIEYCTSLKLSPDDKLPKFLCSNCLNELLKYNRFRRKCLNSKEVLDEALKRHEMGLDDNSEDLFDMYHVDNTENYQTERYQQETQLNENELKEIKKRSDILFSSSINKFEIKVSSDSEELEETEDQIQNRQQNFDRKLKNKLQMETSNESTLEIEVTDCVNMKSSKTIEDENVKTKQRMKTKKRKFQEEENESFISRKTRTLTPEGL